MIYVVGIGPGSKDMMTLEAIKAMENADVIVGYKTYINLITEFIQDKEVVSNGMRQEIDRCKRAVEIAKEGKTVAVISSGDAGIYGMAAVSYTHLMYILMEKNTDEDILQVHVQQPHQRQQLICYLQKIK